jgi:hypothetical protein
VLPFFSGLRSFSATPLPITLRQRPIPESLVLGTGEGDLDNFFYAVLVQFYRNPDKEIMNTVFALKSR